MSESLGLSAEEVLLTTRSVRKRLDLEKPVSRQTIADCIELALQAPTGGNNQGWQWMVVDDAEKKAVIANYYRDAYWPYREAVSERSGGDDRVRVSESADHLANNLERVPAMVIPLHAGRLERGDVFGQASTWGSILPAAWSFMMALRSKGLGSAWTTLHLPKEKETAELLGIDHDNWTQAGLFPVAYTIGTDFKPAKRQPVESFLHFNKFSN